MQSTPGATTTSDPLASAPSVAKPLDTARFEHNPCTVMTGTEASSVLPGVVGELDPKAVLGPTCDWYNLSSGEGFSGGLVPSGLQGVYQRHAQGVVRVLTPVPDIHGYPAAVYGTDPSMQSGECALTVGVADDKTWVVTTLLSQSSEFYSDPCSVVKKAAELGMATMTKGA
jgi:hypothetical protein